MRRRSPPACSCWSLVRPRQLRGIERRSGGLVVIQPADRGTDQIPAVAQFDAERLDRPPSELPQAFVPRDRRPVHPAAAAALLASRPALRHERAQQRRRGLDLPLGAVGEARSDGIVDLPRAPGAAGAPEAPPAVRGRRVPAGRGRPGRRACSRPWPLSSPTWGGVSTEAETRNLPPRSTFRLSGWLTSRRFPP